MKSGSALGMAAVLTAFILTPTGKPKAQNLGLGTGSRAAAEDSSGGDFRPDRQEEPTPPRKSQINKRLGLTARRQGPFDPKVFEARGRELQGQFYEIGSPPAAQKQIPGDPMPTGGMITPRKNGSRQWLVWVGVAGAAGAGAGILGYFLMTNAHPASAPPDIPLNLDDGP